MGSEATTKLYENLENYKTDILNVDVVMKSVFDTANVFISKSFDEQNLAVRDFNNEFFNDISTIESVAILNKFQNNIKIIENRALIFCNSMVTNHAHFDSFSAIIAQNSTCVRGGEKIEITAGVGSFTKSSNPLITFSNKIMPLLQDGVAFYEFDAPQKPGKYGVPVKIDYTDENGDKKTVEKQVEYVVVSEKK